MPFAEPAVRFTPELSVSRTAEPRTSRSSSRSRRRQLEAVLEDFVAVLDFERTDIGAQARDARQPALIRRERLEVVSGVDRGTTGLQRVRLRRTAIVLQRSEQRVQMQRAGRQSERRCADQIIAAV